MTRLYHPVRTRAVPHLQDRRGGGDICTCRGCRIARLRRVATALGIPILRKVPGNPKLPLDFDSE